MSSGRAGKKLEVKLLENRKVRQVTFSKRRKGLFKKAMQLSLLCDAQVSLTIRSSLGKVYRYESHKTPLHIEGVKPEVFMTNDDYDLAFGGGASGHAGTSSIIEDEGVGTPTSNLVIHRSSTTGSMVSEVTATPSPGTPALDPSLGLGPRQIISPNAATIALQQQRAGRRARAGPYPARRTGRGRGGISARVHKSQTLGEHSSSQLSRQVRFEDPYIHLPPRIHASQSETPFQPQMKQDSRGNGEGDGEGEGEGGDAHGKPLDFGRDVVDHSAVKGGGSGRRVSLDSAVKGGNANMQQQQQPAHTGLLVGMGMSMDTHTQDGYQDRDQNQNQGQGHAHGHGRIASPLHPGYVDEVGNRISSVRMDLDASSSVPMPSTSMRTSGQGQEHDSIGMGMGIRRHDQLYAGSGPATIDMNITHTQAQAHPYHTQTHDPRVGRGGPILGMLHASNSDFEVMLTEYHRSREGGGGDGDIDLHGASINDPGLHGINSLDGLNGLNGQGMEHDVLLSHQMSNANSGEGEGGAMVSSDSFELFGVFGETVAEPSDLLME